MFSPNNFVLIGSGFATNAPKKMLDMTSWSDLIVRGFTTDAPRKLHDITF